MEAHDHPIGASMVTNGSQTLEPRGEPEKPEELGFKLPSLIGCVATRSTEAGNPAGEEGRSDVFCRNPFEGPYLGPSGVMINGSEAVVVRSGCWKGTSNVDVDMVKPFRWQEKCESGTLTVDALAMDARAHPGVAITLH